MKDIKKEIIERNSSKEDYGQVLGIEVRFRRIKLSQTLAMTASKICSISYLSKIENNTIEASPLYLREICQQVDLDNDQIDLLMNLREIIENCIAAYLNNVESVLLESYTSGKGFENFRYKIIEFIYYLYNEDIYNANLVYKNLMRVSSTMSDFDLYVFSLFSAILCYYNQFYTDCFETLKLLTNLKISVEFDILRDKYAFLSLYSINSCDTSYAYKSLKEKLLNNGKYGMLEEINYLYSLFLINNKSIYEYSEILKQVTNPKYKESLRLYSDFMDENMNLSSYDENNLTTFTKYLLHIRTNKDLAKEEIENINQNYDYDMNEMLLKYLLIENDNDKLKFMTDIALPNALRNNEKFNCNYFLHELASIAAHNFKYKLFSTYYLKIMNQNN